MSIPESTAKGIFSTIELAPTTVAIKKSECITPESCVVPPFFMFTTVLIVAPAPGIPPMSPATAFPIPCPISSLFGLCFVLLIESATKDVKRESIVPSIASVTA